MKTNLIKSIALAAVAAGLATSSAQALTTTQTFNLGVSPAKTTIQAGVPGLLPWIAKGALPPGSILRRVSVNARIESVDGGPDDDWASDLNVYMDPTPAAPGTAARLQVGGYGTIGTVARALTDLGGNGWANGQGGPPTTVIDDKYEASWASLGAVDLNTVEVSVGNDYSEASWSGTLTIEYDAIEPARIVNFGPAAVIGEVVANAAAITWTVPFGTNVTALAPTFTLSSGTCDKDNGGPTTYNFSSPVNYVVTDGATINTYTVTVIVTPASSAKNIVSFGPGGVIAGTDITWTVPFGSDVTTLAPAYSVSTFASPDALFPTLTPRNFTTPQTYTITAQDLTTQIYTVTVGIAPNESTLIWDLTVNGTWDASSPNWRGQTSNSITPFFNGKNVIFDKTGGGTITITPGMAPLSTTVSATSGTYIFSGNPIATGSLTKSGGGKLELNVTPANFSSIAVNGGTLYLEAADGFAPGSALFTIPNVTVESGATLIGHRMFAEGGTLTMNGGRFFEFNGFSGGWSGSVHLAANSFFGRDGNAYAQQMLGVISGPGGFTYSSGTDAFLGLFNANTYQGPTIVASGRLACIHAAALGNTSALNVASGARVLLAYAGDQVVSSLILGGVTMPAGTYGSSASAAPVVNQLDTYFLTAGRVYFEDYSGTGTVTVAGNPYTTWSGGESFGNDKNGDGVKNGMAFLLGAVTPDENALGRLPIPTKNATGLKMIFSVRKAAARGPAAALVQWSNDLGAADPWGSNVAAVPASTSVVNGVDFQIDSSGALDAVVATIPSIEAASGKLFGRLSGRDN